MTGDLLIVLLFFLSCSVSPHFYSNTLHHRQPPPYQFTNTLDSQQSPTPSSTTHTYLTKATVLFRSLYDVYTTYLLSYSTPNVERRVVTRHTITGGPLSLPSPLVVLAGTCSSICSNICRCAHGRPLNLARAFGGR